MSLLSYLAVQTLLSSIATLVAVFIPGLLVSRQFFSKMNPLRLLLISYCVGVALFSAHGYVLGWLQIRQLNFIFPILSIAVGLFFFRRIHEYLAQLFAAFTSMPKYILILVCIGVLLQSVQMFGNGLPTQNGMHFYRTNAYDGIFHIGLIEAMKETFPPEEPSSSGLAVVNYHYWSDLFISDLSRTFRVSPLFLFFQWQPLLLSFFTSLAVYELIKMFTEKETSTFQTVASVCALLFLIVGSDSGWVFPLYLKGVFTFEYPAIDNGPTQFLNMPHTFGKLFLFVVGIIFLEWRKSKKISTLVLGFLLAAVSFGLKVYFGIALALGFLFSLIADGVQILFQTRKVGVLGLRRLVPLFLSGLIFLGAFAAIYLPVNKNAGGLSWYPLEWPKLLINRDHFDWTTLQYKMAIAAYLHNQPKIVFYNGALVVIGLIAIYGSRAVGFITSKKSLRLFGMHGFLFFMLPAILFTGIGFTTLQVSGGFNVFNFFAVSMSSLVLSLALLCAQIWNKNRVIAFGWILFLLAFSLPRSIFEISSMFSRYRDGFDRVTLSRAEQEAFTTLRSLPLEESESVGASLENPLEGKSTYIRAMSGKPVYLAGKYVLETHNQPYLEKENKLKTLFSMSDQAAFGNLASEMNIRYIWVDSEFAHTPAEKMLLIRKEKALFANDRILIYDRKNL